MGKKHKKSRNRSGLQVITLCISTSMVLILLGMLVLTVFTARNLSSYFKENFTVTLDLAETVTETEAQTLSDLLSQQPYISSVEYISKDSLLKEQTKELGTDPSEFAGYNPFHALIEFQPKAEYANTDSLEVITAHLRGNEKITDIQYPQQLIDQVNSMLQKISLILLVLAGLLLFVSFTLINNTVRLGIYARRFNIHTMKLVGANWSFIRRPFLRRAVFVGLVAGIIAIIVLGIGAYLLYQYEPGITRVLTWKVLLITGVAVLVFGLLITVLCSWFSVNKFLRMKAGELYKI